MDKTAQEIIDEVSRFKDFCKEFDYELDDKMMLQEITNQDGGLFVTPQEELTKISWEILNR